MKKIFFSTLFLGLTQMASAQSVYLENFNSPWPANMVRINNDGKTPAANVNFMGTNAWVTRKTANPADSSAVSTSWYNPAGAADDWMITPAITVPMTNPVIKWRGYAFDAQYLDGYKVKISTSASQTTSGFVDILNVPAENNEWTWRAVDLSAYAGQTVTFAFVNQSNDMFLLGIDDIEVLGMAHAYDVAVTRIKSYEYSTSGNVAIPYRLINNGAKTITSFDINWTTDGTNITTQTVNGVSIGALTTYNGTCSNQLPVTAGTNYNLKVWASNLNGQADEVPANDTLAKKIYGLYSKPAKKTIVEEATGAWCGYCPDGAAKLQTLLNSNPNAIGIANHDSDPMATVQSDSVNSYYIGGYPSGLVDRFYQENLSSVESDRSQWASIATSRNNLAVPFALSGSTSYNAGTRELTINFNATATGDLDQEYRFNAIIVEDSVTGGSTYNQTNYYTSGTPNYGANPIVGYTHRHVMRKMIGGVLGLPNSFPTTVTNGQVVTKTITYTLPANYNADRCEVVLTVQKYTADKNDRPFLNSIELPLNSLTAIDRDGKANGSLKVYPNPMSSSTFVEYTLTSPQEVSFEMLDMTGRQVYSENFGKQSAGVHTFTLNGKEVSNGVYFLKTNINGSIVTEKIVVNK